jgi:polysaccharide pyruvyl transferase WcaK-like protein
MARSIFRDMANAAAFISVRDEQSKEFLLDLNPELDIHVHPDVAFLVSAVYPSEEPPPEKVVGINIMPHATLAAFATPELSASPGRHRQVWNTILRTVLDEGWRVRLMTNGDPLDARAAQEIYRDFAGDDRVVLVPPPARPIDLAHQAQTVTALIASRMHSGIVAHSYGRSVVPIIWDKKVRGVWATADQNVNPVDYFTIDPDMVSLFVVDNLSAAEAPKRFVSRSPIEEIIQNIAAASRVLSGA